MILYLKKYKLIFFLFIILFFYSCKNKSGTIKTDYKIWSENETLKIEVVSDADNVTFKMFQGLCINLEKVSRNKFFASKNINGIDSAIFQYSIITKKRDKDSLISIIYDKDSLDNLLFWKGKFAKDFTEYNEILNGNLIDTIVESRYLSESRKLSIFLPENYKNDTTIPFFFITDGIVVNYYAKYVDYLITSEIIKPVIMVGVHSNDNLAIMDSTNNNPKYIKHFATVENTDYEIILRPFEYVKDGSDTERYTNHQKFFLEEVVSFVETTFEVKTEKAYRYLYGFSNGAAFCVETGLSYPDFANEIVAFSTAFLVTKNINFYKSNFPSFYLLSGLYERSINLENEFILKKMKKHNINCTMKNLVCGHDSYVWRIEFLKYLCEKFPSDKKI